MEYIYRFDREGNTLYAFSTDFRTQSVEDVRGFHQGWRVYTKVEVYTSRRGRSPQKDAAGFPSIEYPCGSFLMKETEAQAIELYKAIHCCRGSEISPIQFTEIKRQFETSDEEPEKRWAE